MLPATRQAAGNSLRFRIAKALHVSPFMPMELDYDWRFCVPGERAAVHMAQPQGGERRVFDATLLAGARARSTGAPSPPRCCAFR